MCGRRISVSSAKDSRQGGWIGYPWPNDADTRPDMIHACSCVRHGAIRDKEGSDV